MGQPIIFLIGVFYTPPYLKIESDEMFGFFSVSILFKIETKENTFLMNNKLYSQKLDEPLLYNVPKLNVKFSMYQ